KRRRWREPMATLTVAVLDADTKVQLPARLSVIGKDGRAYAPPASWLHADDGFDRKRQPFENHYFHCAGSCALEVPVGAVAIRASHGLAYRIGETRITVAAAGARRELRLAPHALPDEFGSFVG